MFFKTFAAILAAAACVRAIPAPDPDCHECDIIHDNQQVPQDQGFEVVIVHVTPEGGCDAQPTQCVFDNGEPEVKATASPQEGYNGYSRQTTTLAHDGPMTTLKPGIHWDHDSKDYAHLVPVPADTGSHMYYGVTG